MGIPTDQPAARITDIDTGHPGSPPTPIISGSSNVLTNNLPAARQGDLLVPHHPGIREISEGSSSVLINNKPAARVSDAINCGGLIVTGSADVLIGDSPSLVTADRIQRLNIQFPSEKGSKKSTKTAPQAKTSASSSPVSSSSASQSSSSPSSATSSTGNAQSPSSTNSLTPAITEDPPEEVTIWLAAPTTKEASNWSEGYIQSILEIATEMDAETEITAAEADIAIVEYSNELPDMFQPMFKPAEDLDKTPAKVTISLIDGITPNGVKPFTEADLLEAAVTFEEMAPLIDAAINGDPLAIAELSPAVITRKPITEEQLASLNEERPKPVAPTPIERLNIEFPNRRKSNPKPAAEMPPLTESQSATVDEIHASLVSSGIKGVGKPEVAEYVTKREALTKQATLLESGTWYRGKAHDVADKNREVALLDYEFARRTDQVGLETSTPVLNVLGLGGITKAAATQAVGKVAKGVTAGKSVVTSKLTSGLSDDASSIIASSTKGQLRKQAALSRACVDELGIVSKNYTNIPGSVKNFPGIRRLDDNFFVIDDQIAYIRQVEKLYADSGNSLNSVTRSKILEHVGNGTRQFPIQAGVPGLHAEVQSVNSVINQVPLGFDLSRVNVSTIKLAPGNGQGAPFPACSNCGGILSNSVNVLTGFK